MVRKDQFHYGPTCIDHPHTAGPDHHAFSHLSGTGWGQISPSFHFHGTDPASAWLILNIQVLQIHVTEDWYVNIQLFGGFVDRSTSGYLYTVSIYGKFYLTHLNSLF
jgi:hypothetical protein